MIEYNINPEISVEDFIKILNRSALVERRPVDDIEVIEGMLKNADIIITAYDSEKIVGIARAVTDHHYCCYLSELAVDKKYQHQGIGKTLILKLKQKSIKTAKSSCFQLPPQQHIIRKSDLKNIILPGF